MKWYPPQAHWIAEVFCRTRLLAKLELKHKRFVEIDVSKENIPCIVFCPLACSELH